MKLAGAKKNRIWSSTKRKPPHNRSLLVNMADSIGATLVQVSMKRCRPTPPMRTRIGQDEGRDTRSKTEIDEDDNPFAELAAMQAAEVSSTAAGSTDDPHAVQAARVGRSDATAFDDSGFFDSPDDQWNITLCYECKKRFPPPFFLHSKIKKKTPNSS